MVPLWHKRRKMMNKNIKIARELIKIAKSLVASNITKEDISKAWKTSDYLWKQFIKKHNDMNCFIVEVKHQVFCI